MMNNLYRKTELLANVAIILAACALIGVLTERYLSNRAPADSRAQGQEMAVGSKVSLPGVDWKKNEQTLLLVLQKGCRFCTESAPFYQRMLQTWAGPTIAVFPHSIEAGQEYLADLKLPIKELRQAALDDLAVAGTPTLLLVDRAGKAAAVWVGQLPPEQEQEVLGRLQAVRAGGWP